MTASTVTNRFSWSSLPVTAIAISVSGVFSLLSVLQHPQLNDDAYGYLRAAELFDSDGMGAVLGQYNWPGYSMLFALLDPVLPGGLLVAAQVLNAACYALVVYAFIALVKEGHAAVRVHWFAALTILAYPLINEMRYFLIRDFAFWGLVLLSLLHLVRYRQQQRWQSALYWCLALIAAIAFRPEGLLLAAFAPLALLGAPSTGRRWPALGLLYGLLLAALLLLFLALLALQVNLVELFQFAYRYYLPLLYDLPRVLGDSVTAANQALFTATNFPGHDAMMHGGVIVMFAYLYILLANTVAALSVPLSLLLAYAAWRGWVQVPASLRAPLWLYVGCSMLGLLIFLIIMHFLTQRYATLLCLLLLLLVPPILDKLYSLALAQQHLTRFRAVLGFCCIYFFADSLISFGHSTSYVSEAMTWSRDKLPPDATLHTNEFAIAYASGRVEDYDKVSPDPMITLAETQPSHYLALSLKRDDDDLRSQLEASPQLLLLQRFANERGDEVRIYQHRQE
jgi:hypothetical protein